MTPEDEILETIKDYRNPNQKKQQISSSNAVDNILSTISSKDASKKEPERDLIKEQIIGTPQEQKNRGTLSDMASGFLSGISNIPYGISQLATRALGATPDQAKAASLKAQKQYEQTQQLNPLTPYPMAPPPQFMAAPETAAGKTGEILGESAILAPITGGIGGAAAKMLPQVATKIPSLMAGIGGATAGGVTAPIIAAGKNEQDLISPTAMGAASGGLLGSALSKIAPALLTHKISPFQITNQVKPLIADQVAKLKNTFSMGRNPHNIDEDLFNNSKQYFSELRGKVSPESYRYISPRSSTDYLYEQAYKDLILPNSFKNLKSINDQETQLFSKNIEALPKGSDLRNQMEKAFYEIKNYKPKEAITPKDEQEFIIKKLNEGKDLRNIDYSELEGSKEGFSLNDARQVKNAKNALKARIKELYFKKDKTYADRELSESLQKIKKSLYDDLKEISLTNPSSKSSMEIADDYYHEIKKNFVEPYKGKITPFYKKYMGEEGSENFLSSYIHPNKHKDNINDIKNLFEIIPTKEDRNLVKGWIFKDADTPKQMVNRYNQFGKKQKDILFGEQGVSEERNELESLSKLYKKYPHAFKEEAPYEKHLKTGMQLAGAATAAFKGYPGVAAAAAAYPAGQNIVAPLMAKLRPSLLQDYMAGKIMPKPTPGILSRSISSIMPDIYQTLRGTQR